MRILWLTHAPIDHKTWEGSRHYHLLRQLGPNHEIHYISWQKALNPLALARWGSYATSPNGLGTAYRVQLGPNLPDPLGRGYPRPILRFVNQRFYQRALGRIIRQVKPQVMVYSSSEHFTGFPPFPSGCPILFDFLDLTAEYVELKFLKNATRVVGVSPDLCAKARRHGKPAQLIPNGVSLPKYRDGDRRRAKEELGLSGLTVVSLIGLTCGPTLYFVEAAARAQQDIRDLCLLVVGQESRNRPIARRAQRCGIRRFLAPGHIPAEQVHKYFLATDIGLYPGDDIPYYHEACPVKILEYTAAGAQVVTSPVRMFRDWPNVRTAAATAEAFANAILEASGAPKPCPDMTPYDWPRLAREFEQALSLCAKNA